MNLNLSLYEAGIFDLDDTLTESGGFMVDTNRALLIKSAFWENFKNTIDGSPEDLPRVCGFDLFQQINYWLGTLTLEDSQREGLLEDFKQFTIEEWGPLVVSTFENTAPQNIDLCPGAEALMSYYSGTYRVFGILTNNQRAIAKVILKRAGIDGYKILTTANDAPNKPDAEGHLIQVDKLGVDVDRIISVGDSLNDMRAAVNADIAKGLLIDAKNKTTRAEIADEFGRRVNRTNNLEETIKNQPPSWI